MSLLFGRAETRSIDDLPWDRGGSVRSVTTVESALRLIPVYSAVSGIADDVATMPLHTYRDQDGIRRRVPDPSIVTSPGVGADRIAWRCQAMSSLLLRGNAYGLITSLDGRGWPTKVVWLHPDHVVVDERSGTPRYTYQGRPLDASSVVHIPGFVLPGSVVGLSPVSLFRLQLSRGMSAQQYAADFFDKGIMPPGVLRNRAKVLKPGEADIAKSRFKESVKGRDIFVTGNDWEWSALSVPKDDAAFLETIQAGATEIAAIYRVSPEDIGGKSGDSMTYKTLESNEMRRARRALMPWTARIESALSALMPAPQYVKFNLDAIARADLKTRMEAHAIALDIGLETNDEGRALEDRPPLTPAQREEWQASYRPQGAATTVEGQTDEDA